MARFLSAVLVAASAAAAAAPATLTYDVTVGPESVLEVPAAAALSLFFLGGDDLCWREDEAGRVEITRPGGEPEMTLDPRAAGEVYFLSLFEKKFVKVGEPRAQKILTLYDFYLKREVDVGDELALDYPLRDNVYHVATRATTTGTLALNDELGEAPYIMVEGEVTGWDKDRRATVTAWLGTEGELAGRLLKLSFKFADWPRVTMTLARADKG